MTSKFKIILIVLIAAVLSVSVIVLFRTKEEAHEAVIDRELTVEVEFDEEDFSLETKNDFDKNPNEKSDSENNHIVKEELIDNSDGDFNKPIDNSSKPDTGNTGPINDKNVTVTSEGIETSIEVNGLETEIIDY